MTSAVWCCPPKRYRSLYFISTAQVVGEPTIEFRDRDSIRLVCTNFFSIPANARSVARQVSVALNKFAMSSDAKELPPGPAKGQQSLYPDPNVAQPPSYEETMNPEERAIPFQPTETAAVIAAPTSHETQVPVVQRKEFINANCMIRHCIRIAFPHPTRSSSNTTLLACIFHRYYSATSRRTGSNNDQMPVVRRERFHQNWLPAIDQNAYHGWPLVLFHVRALIYFIHCRPVS